MTWWALIIVASIFGWFVAAYLSALYVTTFRNPFLHDGGLIAVGCFVFWPVLLPWAAFGWHHTDPLKCRKCRKAQR